MAFALKIGTDNVCCPINTPADFHSERDGQSHRKQPLLMIIFERIDLVLARSPIEQMQEVKGVYNHWFAFYTILTMAFALKIDTDNVCCPINTPADFHGERHGRSHRKQQLLMITFERIDLVLARSPIEQMQDVKEYTIAGLLFIPF